MASIVPIGKEAEMFALFEITDKGSSWIGPLTVAIITNFANLRWGMAYCAVFFLIPIPILKYGVNIDKAVAESGRMVLEKSRSDSVESPRSPETPQVDPTPKSRGKDEVVMTEIAGHNDKQQTE